MRNRYFPHVLVAGCVASLLGTGANALTIFTENFNSYSGTQNTNQYQTGFPVAYGGNVTGWSKSGTAAAHAVNLDGAGNWAIMVWQNNVITLTTGIAANDAGVPYKVEFDYGTAVYHTDGAFQRTQTGDGLKVEVLRADNSVLTSQSFFPGAWDTSGNRNLDAGLHGTLQYVGDGSGVVRLRIGPDGLYSSGRFEGEIDNITVTQVVAPVALVNNSASNRRLYSATFNASLGVPSTNASVYVHWGTADGTNNPAAWSRNAHVGSWTNVASTNITFTASGLAPDTPYYYTFRATNDGTNVWASPSTSFSTLTPTVFTENFNTYSGTTNNTQYQTGLPVAYGGGVPGWTNSGAGAVHAVNLGGGNMAIMFYKDNVITLTNGIAANEVGVTYNVEFDYGTAVYNGANEMTVAGDGLKVEVLREDNSVLASQSFFPGAWDTSGNRNLDARLHGTLQYTGDGLSNVRLRIGPDGAYTSNRFEGEIDNLKVTVYVVTKTALGTVLVVQ